MNTDQMPSPQYLQIYDVRTQKLVTLVTYLSEFVLDQPTYSETVDIHNKKGILVDKYI